MKYLIAIFIIFSIYTLDSEVSVTYNERKQSGINWEYYKPLIIAVESSNNHLASSWLHPRHDRGLMGVSDIGLFQYLKLNPTCRWTPSDMYDPQKNVIVGTWTLKWLESSYRKQGITNNILELCLASYWQGCATTERLGITPALGYINLVMQGTNKL